MDRDNRYFTLKGYQIKDAPDLTPAMEDYLEMIYRILQNAEVARIGQVAANLHVKPSSATKMIQQLSRLGYVDAPRYGYVRLTPKGRERGEYLIYRHRVLFEFLSLLNGADYQLEQVEKIEHFVDPATVEGLRRLTEYLKGSADFQARDILKI